VPAHGLVLQAGEKLCDEQLEDVKACLRTPLRCKLARSSATSGVRADLPGST
jgi:hypothetical protein